MSINFERNYTQVLYEEIIGISKEELYNRKDEFQNHSLTQVEANELKESLKIDALNFFYNGVVSFSEGVSSAFNKHFSWSTVKLYYSLYYFIRATMASKGIALLRCRKMYRLKTEAGEKPYSTGSKRYNTTHEGTINHYKDLFADNDKLLSNNIDDKDAYAWMMEAREIVNYRSSVFAEPQCLNIWEIFFRAIDEKEYWKLLNQLVKDEYTMCFQEEYAIIAIPMLRFKQSIEDMKNTNLLAGFNLEWRRVVRNILGREACNLEVMDWLTE